MAITPTQWQRRVKITAQGSQPNLSNFVAVITEANLPAEIWSIALNGGGDLRLCLNSDGTGQLPLEVVNFDTSAQKAVLWTRFPSFATGTSCWLFYGKAGETQPPVTDTYGRNAVWVDAYQKFHLDESTGTVAASSTGSNDGTYTSPLPRIGANGGQDFINSDVGVVNIGNAASLSNSAFTLSATIRPDAVSLNKNIIGSDNSGFRNWQWRVESGGQLTIIVWDESGTLFIGETGSTVLSTTQPSKVDFVFDGSNYITYLNGSPEITVANTTLSRRSNQMDVYIGARRDGTGSDKFDGEIFDAEIWSGSAKSPDYISTEYANQSSPATFFLAGTPENTTGGGGVSSSVTLTLPVPLFSANASATLPQPQSDISITLPAPAFSVNASATIPGFDASVSVTLPAPVFSASASVTLPQPSADIAATIPAPTFAASASASLPQPELTASITLPAPLFSVSASATTGGATVNLTIPAPTFAASASATLPQPIATAAWEIPAPVFSVSATVSGIVIIAGADSRITVEAASNRITLQAASNRITI